MESWREKEVYVATTKVVLRPNCELINNYMDRSPFRFWMCSNPDFGIRCHTTNHFIVLISWDIDILKEWIINYFTWVGNRGLENGKHLYFVFRTIILRLLFWFICIAYFHAENLDYCVYYFLKTSALIGVVLWHSWFFLNILKYIPNICHKNTWLIINLKVLKLRIGM